MFKKLSLLLLTTILTPILLNAEWVPLDNNRAVNTPPKVTLLSDSPSSTVIRIELSGFELKEFRSAGKTYQSVDLLTDILTTDPGHPELPYIAKILAVPDHASVSVEVLETGNITTFKDINLPPARASWYEGETEPAYAENADAYRSDNTYPDVQSAAEPPMIFRDFRISRVSIYPMRYIPGKKELQVASSVTVRVDYGTDRTVNPKTTISKAIAPSFAKLYRSTIFNYQEVLNREYGGREEGRDVVLAIMPDEFYNSFQVYAEWKKQSGYDVHVTKFFEIGGNTNNPDVIKAYIADAYHNWEFPPTYIIIVGDDGVFPKKIVTYPDYSFPDEDYFVEIDGNDYFPEMFIGRFTNQGDYRMQVMINKFMLYEKHPNTVSAAWFKKGTVCSNNAYESQKWTKRFAATRMLQFGGFTSVDTLMSDGDYWGGNCTVDLQDVINAINEGRSYLNYRGEGWSDGWQASCYSFHTSDVSSLMNGEKFTFVTSIGCGVAMFDAWGANNCFGEEWVELGSLTAPRGAACFVGPTSNTHTTYNNKIDMGIYMGMFQEGMDTPGEALVRGKLYMYNVYGGDYYTEYHFYIYCILGDPSIHIWKDVPLAVTVNHADTILVGPNDYNVDVSFTASGAPAAGAQVTLANEEIFATGFCDANGHISLHVTPALPDTLVLTVIGGKVYPSQSEVIIVQPAELVVPQEGPAIVDIDGNHDGLVDPNEHCNATFTLRNWGSQTAVNVNAVLSSTDEENIQVITTNPVSFGNLAPGASYTGAPFEFYVLPDCPVGQVIPLHLHVTSSDDSWDYDFSVTVNGCDLIVFNYMVNDESSPNPNYRMDPGETVMLFLTVKNQGNDNAPNVMGFLSSDDPYITIEDSTGTFGTLSIGEMEFNASDYYVVHVAPNCPVEHIAAYNLNLKTYNGNYPYRHAEALSIPVSKPVPSDFTGPDAYGYYAYTSDDYFDNAPDYSWYEINGLGTEINAQGLGEYTETVSLPFTFRYYGMDQIQIRISTDGWMAFGSGNQTAPINTGLPHNDNINCMVAGFWDDLWDSETIEGNIYYYNDNINHRFIIEYDSIARNDFGSEPSVETFQVVFYNPAYYPTTSGDGEIIINYQHVAMPESCTVGIENNTQAIGLQYLFNYTYDPTATPLVNEFSIKFTTEPPYSSLITSVDEGNPGLTENGYELRQNSPNPFRSGTTISYTIPEACQVTLSIFDANGVLVATLLNGKQPAGTYSARWSGRSDSGNPVSSGIYLYQLKTDNFSQTRKMFISR